MKQSGYRGSHNNGAGQIKNIIIKHFAIADWVTFVDNDDTLIPYYIDYIQEVKALYSAVDIFVFRMIDRHRKILPSLDCSGILKISEVGISFAVRRELFVRSKDPIFFVPHAAEDYNYLRAAQEKNASIMIGSKVAYYVCGRPILEEHAGFCLFENATVA